MSDVKSIVQINESEVKNHLSEMVRSTVEETLNTMLDQEADEICGAKRYERTDSRKDTRAGFYSRKLQTQAGEVSLKVPRLRKLPFESMIIERYKRREASVEESLIEMYLAGVSVRRVEDITDAYSTESGHLIQAIGESYPEARWQRCAVHFYRNVFSLVPKARVKEVAAMLKAIHASEDLEAADSKAKEVIAKFDTMKLPKASSCVKDGIRETFSYFHFPREHWIRIRTNNMLERVMREIRRRTRVVGNFPDGNSALMLTAARLRHIASSKWGTKKYLDMNRLREAKLALLG